jgi:uncharacterized protein YPO0396
MTEQAPIVLLMAKEQFRMSRLQVFNWGTFSGLHDIPIAERGFLFVGRSGAGKSTLLDAFSALLVPPRWVDFNAAAREADRIGRDRNLVSYIRGAWAEQKDNESGEIVTRYLRSGTTWSALALTYQNKLNEAVTLVQVLWLRGNGNNTADLKRHYLIFERPVALSELEVFGQANLDMRKLKQSFPTAFFYDEFRPYCERFCRLLGIENEMALRLLHKTQSAKNLGDLNTFLREFMLDKPQTFDVADRLISEFGELNAAHQAVVTARDQVQILLLARHSFQDMQTLVGQKNDRHALQVGITHYREHLRRDLLKQRLDALHIEASAVAGELVRCQTVLDIQQNTLRDLEQQHRDIGGAQIEQWQKEKGALEQQRHERLRKYELADQACKQLGWMIGDSPRHFAELVGNARQEVENREQISQVNREKQLQFASQKKEAESEFAQVIKEVQALLRQPSNIPADMLELRKNITTALSISEESLPFVGELIEIKADEKSWQGAIERVLHGFALSLLVDERHYSALVNHINHTHLGQRLVYYRTGRVEAQPVKPISAESLVLKLQVKEGPYGEWLWFELRQRFDYACVDSMQSFKQVERALTREGQIKHNKTRHEKDDRRNVQDKRYWVTGFDNREKLTLFQKQSQVLADRISACGAELKTLIDQDRHHATRIIHCQTLVNLQWQEIDVVPLMERIAIIEQNIRKARDGNSTLQNLAAQLLRQQDIVRQADNDFRKTSVAHDKINNQIEESGKKLSSLQQDLSIVQITPHQQQGLDERFAMLSDKVSLENLDRLTTTVVQRLNEELEEINRKISHCEKIIENRFADFKRSWPMDAGDLDTSLASAPDFFAKLTRLETDGLPAYEQRFFELLQNQSHQNLAALSTYLRDARKAILERMTLVNESLSQVPFNQSAAQKTYLHIVVSDRNLPDVRAFKQEIQHVLSHAWSEDRNHAEQRFLTLRSLVDRLSSQESEQKRWRELVLDVRLHVEFIGREIDEEGVEIEIYRSGAGKSGGQRQKLATTCLAAALRYQLGSDDCNIPVYAPVILDEAFDKADNEFTALAMNIFTNFGFQMIVATPLKSVMTLEHCIGGACFVDINDRRVSGVLLISYDEEEQRLKLNECMDTDVCLEVTT